MSQPWRTSSIAASLAILVCVPSATEGQAAFADGVWLGNAVALGPIDAPDGTWHGRVEAWFDLFVDQGAVQGDVTVSAAGTANIRSNPPGVIRQAGSGSGTAQGSPTALQFMGSVDMAHVAVTTHAAGRTAVAGTSNDPLSIRVRITSATCTDVEGEWIQDWNVLAGSRGYTTPLHGTFAAVRQDDAAYQDLRDWLYAVENGQTPGPPPPGSISQLPTSIRSVAGAFRSTFQAFHTLMNASPRPAATVAPTLQEFVRLVALLRALDECSKQMLGPHYRDLLEKAAGNAGTVIRTWATANGPFDRRPNGREVRMLVGYGATIGVWDSNFNSNASNDENAVHLEAERLLEPYVQELYSNAPGVAVNSTFESRQLVDAAEFMGWSMNYGGYDYRGSELKASLR